MKVILLKDIEALGKAFDVKDVSDGHAANHLLPRKLAIAATPASLKANEERKQKEQEKKQAHIDAMKELARTIESKEVLLSIGAGEGGKLFGAATNKDIADALKNQHHIDIDRHKIELSAPIKQVGTHKVKIKLAADITPSLKVSVQAK